MACTIEVLFTPAEFRALGVRDLSRTVCVVFDVLRATSSFVTALANGAQAIIPVEEISEALEIRRLRPEVLLAGERDGLRISAALTGGVEFDLGNSPREFTPERVRGRTIVSTTTNGTRALRACAGARHVFVGSFLNLSATTHAALACEPEILLLVCAGTGQAAALEDALAAGAFCESLTSSRAGTELFDSAQIARHLYTNARQNLRATLNDAQNARRLRAHPGLREDVNACLQLDRHPVKPGLNRTGEVVLHP
jgi:2-phosphosulfolactate phosphatase